MIVYAKSNTLWIQGIAAYFIVFIVLFLTLSPTIWVEEASHDDLQYLHISNSDDYKSHCANEPFVDWSLIQGRSIDAAVQCQVFKHTRQLSDLSKIRTLLVGVISLSILVFCRILYRFTKDFLFSIFISVAIFTLPPEQNSIFNTLSLTSTSPLFSVLAFYFTDKISEILPWRTTEDKFRLALAILALIISALFYPAMTFVFFWGAMLRTILIDSFTIKYRLHLFLRDTIIFGLSAALSIVISRIALFIRFAFYGPNIGNDAGSAKLNFSEAYERYRSALRSVPPQYKADFSISGLLGRLHIIIDRVVPESSKLWFSFNEKFASHVVIFICIFAICALIYAAMKCARRDATTITFLSIVAKILITLLTIFFAGFPIIIPSAPMTLQRELFATEGLFFLILFVAIPFSVVAEFPVSVSARRNITRALGVVVLCAGLGLASYATSKNVTNTNMEMQFVRNELARYDRLPRRVHIIQPPAARLGFNGLPEYGDEINVRTTEFSNDLEALVRVALWGSANVDMPITEACDPSARDCETDTPAGGLYISFSEYGGTFCRTNNMVVVDMNILVRATHTGTPDLVKPEEMPACTFGKSKSEVRLMVEGYKTYNIMQVGSTFVAILQADGVFDAIKLAAGGYHTPVSGGSIAEIEQKIDAVLKP